ncbi:YesL family protein [Microbacterium sp. A93]|uniref:YesL family protein n=1 Tax=Microbacterium sp. A93 TaxID=3450716 RepID=UPI003F42D61F
MRIDPEGRTAQGITGFLSFVTLNLLYLLLCLPIVTIGAATAALYQVTIRYSDDESGRPLKDFFPAFVRNFKPASLLTLALLLPVLLLLAVAVFWSGSATVVGGVAMVVSIIAALYLFAAFLYAMALTALYETPFRQTARNALLLPMAQPLRTMGILLVPAALVCITVVIPMFGVILVTVGFSVGAYMTAFLFRSAFARHTPGA